MKPNAIILTGDKLATPGGKTAHGLLRGTSRYNIVGVIDTDCCGRDAGTVLDGVFRGIPVYASIQDFISQSPETAAYGIIGVALHGGRLPDAWTHLVLSVIQNGIGIVNGLHQLLADDPGLRARLEAGAAALAEEFTWERIARRTLAFYETLMA